MGAVSIVTSPAAATACPSLIVRRELKLKMQPRTAQRRQALCAPAALRTSAPAKRSVAVRAAVCTEENAGDVAWNKTYYPKMVDAAKVEKDWYVVILLGVSSCTL